MNQTLCGQRTDESLFTPSASDESIATNVEVEGEEEEGERVLMFDSFGYRNGFLLFSKETSGSRGDRSPGPGSLSPRSGRRRCR